ncbi:zf-HC2 domain-containing protein [Arachnia propionica]|uniref:Anti-sigma factor n=1 Tax=Arachnia propionica TaxID=1750 RepID=A0A3P1WWF1_9ACTN|nr:zf-HC2 domain-containing protein [Arachnia propionica]RRD50545.1 anti-sigma factor [Arachnia propionica]
MTDPVMWSHDHDDMDECVRALEAVHAFLHGELGEVEADLIREHLHACELCMESFEIEQTITHMIHRSQPLEAAPSMLRQRLTLLCLERSGQE